MPSLWDRAWSLLISKGQDTRVVSRDEISSDTSKIHA